MMQNGVPHLTQRHFEVRILRQDRPQESSYWERFRLPHEPGLNVTSVLQQIAAHPVTADGRSVAPIAYDANCLEEVCGSCTMLINGRVRQACSALVDRLLAADSDQIELRPMSKFPVIRDLVVARGRLFRALEKLHCWVEVDGYFDRGPGPRQSPLDQQQAYPLSTCMSCGCCLDACPQYRKIELTRRTGESADEFSARERTEFDLNFIGAHANSQVVLMNAHPTGRMTASQRLDALIAPGGIQNCGKAGNCQAVCPKEIPLMTSWGRAGRAATLHGLKKLLDG
ncbi:MAG: succinate dehydrogenase iron-sulfur subunit [Pirellulales bacterium]|nr:succinate dehydrogenase iron-sulfur subunit [Pirellulales bacterium]